MRAGDLIGRTARDLDGTPLGRVADLITRQDRSGRAVVTAVLVTPRHRGRLLGFERPGARPPAVLERLSRLLHRGTREIPWDQVRIDDGPTAANPPTTSSG
ncbi:PRC-barrel domain containing protein [Actinosynnema sp. NPDC050436]|uniref:PRC-barrel domain-containing protein n=1 Tax=Actinosynnema sp. NPDC050436 TaxID=3155659 RepID=UPI0033F3A534